MTLGSGLMVLALLQAGGAPVDRTLSVTASRRDGRSGARPRHRQESRWSRTASPSPPSASRRDQRPLDLALVVDTSQPMASLYRLNVLEPVVQFLGHLPEGTQFVVWTTGDRPTKAVDYGDDPAVAERDPAAGDPDRRQRACWTRWSRRRVT